MTELQVIFLCLILIVQILSIAIQLTIFSKLNQTIMSAQTEIEGMIDEVLLIIAEAFNTNVGDLTEQEAKDKRADFVARVNAIFNPPPPPTP